MGITYDPTVGSTGEFSLWFDGVKVTAEPAASKCFDRTLTGTFVGRSWWVADSTFNGEIQMLKVYNKVLTAAEMVADIGILLPPTYVINGTGATPAYTTSTIPPKFENGSFWLQGSGLSTDSNPNAQWLDFGSRMFNVGSRGFSATVVFRWFRWGSGESVWERLFDLNGIILTRNAAENRILFFVVIPGSAQYAATDVSFASGVWYSLGVRFMPHIGVAGEFTFWLDGVKVQTYTLPSPRILDRVVANSWVGKSWAADNAITRAEIRALNIYNRAIHDAEIYRDIGPKTPPIIQINSTSAFPVVSTSVSAPAFVDGALVLNGTGTSASTTCQFLTFGPKNLYLGSRGFTATLRFKFFGSIKNWERIFDLGNTLTQDTVMLGRYLTTKQLAFVVSPPGRSHIYRISPLIIEQEQVVNMAVELDPTEGPYGMVTWWMDGVQVYSEYFTGIQPKFGDTVVANTFLGKIGSEPNGALSASIYSLNIYNRMLSESEIQADTFPKEPIIAMVGNRIFPSTYTTSNKPPRFESNATVFEGSGNCDPMNPGLQFLDFGPQTFKFGSFGFAVTVIFKSDGSISGDYERIFDFGNAAGGQNLLLTRAGKERDNLHWHNYINGFFPRAIPIKPNGINRIALMYDPSIGNTGEHSVWIDGVKFDSSPATNRAPSEVKLSNTFIGRSWWPVNDALRGTIYQLKVYNRALKAAEIYADAGFLSDPILFITSAGMSSVSAVSANPPWIDNKVIRFRGTGLTDPSNPEFRYFDFGPRTLPLRSQGLTFTFIFEILNNVTVNFERILEFGNGMSSGNVAIVRNGNNAIALSVRTQGFTWIAFTPAMNIETNRIYRFAFQIDPTYGPFGRRTFWVNGTLLETQVNNVPMSDRTVANSYVGGSLYPSDSVTNANLYMLKVYDRVLSAEEIFADIGSMPVRMMTTSTTTSTSSTLTTSTSTSTTSTTSTRTSSSTSSSTSTTSSSTSTTSTSSTSTTSSTSSTTTSSSTSTTTISSITSKTSTETPSSNPNLTEEAIETNPASRNEEPINTVPVNVPTTPQTPAGADDTIMGLPMTTFTVIFVSTGAVVFALAIIVGLVIHFNTRQVKQTMPWGVSHAELASTANVAAVHHSQPLGNKVPWVSPANRSYRANYLASSSSTLAPPNGRAEFLRQQQQQRHGTAAAPATYYQGQTVTRIATERRADF